jgi:hypothetical protein
MGPFLEYGRVKKIEFQNSLFIAVTWEQIPGPSHKQARPGGVHPEFCLADWDLSLDSKPGGSTRNAKPSHGAASLSAFITDSKKLSYPMARLRDPLFLLKGTPVARKEGG